VRLAGGGVVVGGVYYTEIKKIVHLNMRFKR